jgi:Synaptobrevin/Regulated-SNARE-like domain
VSNSIAHVFHTYARTEGVCGVIISDQAYPSLVAHQLLSKVVDEFLSKYPRSTWSAEPPPACSFPALNDYIVKYQDPTQADSIMKIQRELDETKIVLHKTIESVLERGEKIDSLVEKSQGLSAQSKMFYGQVSTPSMRFQTLAIILVLTHIKIYLLTSTCNRQRNRTRAAWLCESDSVLRRAYFLCSILMSRVCYIFSFSSS